MCVSAALIAGGLLGGTLLSREAMKPDEIDKTPPPDPEAARQRARERSKVARGRAQGGFGFGQTFMTGPGGLQGGSSGKGAKTLLGQ